MTESIGSRGRPFAALAAGVCILALTACASTAVAAPAPDAQRVDGGTIVYAHQQEPACVYGGWIEQAYLSYQVLDSLTSLDEHGEVVPWLATDWSASTDGLTWTFKLADGVSFTDGSPVDAEAVAYNVEHWLQGGNSTANVWLQSYVERATAVGDTTVQLHLARPYPLLAENLSQGYFGIQSKVALQTRTPQENCEAPIGSGAFVVERWDRGSSIKLVRNDNYTSWPANAQHQGPAYIEAIEWRFVAEPIARTSSLRAGEVDAIYDVPAVEWAQIGEAGFELIEHVTAGRPQQLTFNTQQGPFTDLRVRQAFAYGLDRPAIVEAVGHGVIPYEGNGGVSQSTPSYSQEAADRYAYDPALAQQLLAEAGWSEIGDDGIRVKDGERLTIRLPYGAGSIINAEGASMLQSVAAQAREVGFDVQLIPVPQSAFFGGAYAGVDEKELSVGYWTAVGAGILYINWRPHTEDNPNYNNNAFLDDPVLGELIERANSARDPAEQNRAYVEAQLYLADKALTIGLYDRLSTLAVNPALHGVWQEHAQGGPVFHDAYFVA